MADKKESQPKKRRVRNPETFRERAIKASEAAGKPESPSRARQVRGRLASGGAKPLKKAAGFRPVRLAGKVIIPAYLRNSWRELRLVTWPTWKQSRQLTLAVIIFAVIFGSTIAAVDYGLDKIFRNILLK